MCCGYVVRGQMCDMLGYVEGKTVGMDNIYMYLLLCTCVVGYNPG